MDPHAVVTPPHVAGPLRLAPFAAMRLRPQRVGDPSTGRAFARPYRGVAARLARWQERGRLHRDDTAALYLHEYSANGITVRGLVGALDVSHRATRAADRAVLPHEGIHPAQADDLADRMEDMRINPAPILLVHRDTDRGRAIRSEVVDLAPDHEFTDRSRQHHRIWAVTDPDLVAELNTEIASSRALIADGHHRYAAYLRLQRRHPGTGFDTGLAMLVDQVETPLFLGAVHRSFAGTALDDLRDAAAALGLPYGEHPRTGALAALDSRHVVATDGDRWASVALPVEEDQAAVEMLHAAVVPALPHGPSAVNYHHTVDHALKATRASGTLAVLMPAPTVELVHRIAADDRLLPEKATSFQPKPSLGVLIRPIPDAPRGSA
ncbi:DUF1015 domain-containing protein [Nocardioides panacisoli]|uniref:DUF1015 family protein n=1 Tax=Nocardioides panacisoli TaxID=627624 RepID=UPI001C63A574|nr:DUF1015 family protein [Nocardioides panacisoli]QYJ05148.1 DUF1015 domain-containing protein [Nocardioides panacisoli]